MCFFFCCFVSSICWDPFPKWSICQTLLGHHTSAVTLLPASAACRRSCSSDCHYTIKIPSFLCLSRAQTTHLYSLNTVHHLLFHAKGHKGSNIAERGSFLKLLCTLCIFFFSFFEVTHVCQRRNTVLHSEPADW